MFGNDSIEMKEEYDVVTLSGGFVPGHVPMTALNDFIQMCKPGGIITIIGGINPCCCCCGGCGCWG